MVRGQEGPLLLHFCWANGVGCEEIGYDTLSRMSRGLLRVAKAVQSQVTEVLQIHA